MVLFSVVIRSFYSIDRILQEKKLDEKIIFFGMIFANSILYAILAGRARKLPFWQARWL